MNKFAPLYKEKQPQFSKSNEFTSNIQEPQLIENFKKIKILNKNPIFEKNKEPQSKHKVKTHIS